MATGRSHRPRPTPETRAAQVDDWQDRSRRLAALSSKLNARGDVDDAILVLDASLEYRRRATEEINSWPETKRRSA